MGSTRAEYEAWQAEHMALWPAVFERIDALRDDTEAWARQLSAQARRNPTVANRKRAAEAWARLRELDHIDPLGRSVDDTFAGRAKWERAWLLATGHPFTHPDDDDTPPEHAAGEHQGTTLRRSFGGDLPPCGACMDDELWADFRARAIRRRNA